MTEIEIKQWPSSGSANRDTPPRPYPCLSLSQHKSQVSVDIAHPVTIIVDGGEGKLSIVGL